jgi:SWI/SNF-related matrix-associated actin-dependent regulator 1 of chromatin subfamily A
MAFQRYRPLTDDEKKTYELSKAVASDFKPRHVSDDLKYLPFQLAGIEFGIKNKNILLGDEPGIGKTVQAIGICNEVYATRILVVCPAKLINVWVTHLNRWLIGHKSIGIFHPKKENKEHIIVSSIYWSGTIEGVKALKSLGRFNVLILDEAHLYKELKTMRTKYTYSKNGLISVADRVLALSGTAIVNRPMELYTTIKALKPECLGQMNKFGFGVRYCAGWNSPWGWDFSGASNLKELGIAMRASGFMVRRQKVDVLKDLPKKFINLIYVDPTKDVVTKLKSYDDAEKSKDTTVAFEDIARMNALLGVSKAGFALDYIDTLMLGGHKKIVMFAHHKEVFKLLEAGLKERKIDSYKLTGETKNEHIEDLVKGFQETTKPAVFLGSVKAAGVGLTLTSASYVVFAEYSWVPGENSQAMDRCHRIGQDSNVVVDFLVYENTLDERKLKSVLAKEKAMGEFYE